MVCSNVSSEPKSSIHIIWTICKRIIQISNLVAVPRKNKVFEQLWCLIITSKDRTVLVAYAWMTRKNQISYEKILRRLSEAAEKPLAVTGFVTDQEPAEFNALEKLVSAESIHRCGFHSSKKFREKFCKNLKKDLVKRREQPRGHDQKIINHCLKASRIIMYLPHAFAISFCDYLIEYEVNKIMDDTKELELKSVMESIRNDILRDPKIHWFDALMVAGSWVDVTSNKDRIL